MKKLLFILIALPMIGFGQFPLLDEKNGFKDIKLGDDVRNYDFIKKCDDDNLYYTYPYWNTCKSCDNRISHSRNCYSLDKCEIWIVDSNNKKHHTFAHNTEIRKVFIETYDFKIVTITMYIENKNSDRYVAETFKKVFGSPENSDFCRKDIGTEPEREKMCIISWYTDKISLMAFAYHYNNISHNSEGRLTNSKDKRRVGWLVKYEDLRLRRLVKDLVEKADEERKKRYKKNLEDKF